MRQLVLLISDSSNVYRGYSVVGIKWPIIAPSSPFQIFRKG
jgi:hypothetical protein